jgi:hypothetical protein
VFHIYFQSEATNNGLSTGEYIGIGIGVFVIFIVIIVVIVTLIRNQSERTRTNDTRNERYTTESYERIDMFVAVLKQNTSTCMVFQTNEGSSCNFGDLIKKTEDVLRDIRAKWANIMEELNPEQSNSFIRVEYHEDNTAMVPLHRSPDEYINVFFNEIIQHRISEVSINHPK